jgi:hypothetical protein
MKRHWLAVLLVVLAVVLMLVGSQPPHLPGDKVDTGSNRTTDLG